MQHPGGYEARLLIIIVTVASPESPGLRIDDDPFRLTVLGAHRFGIPALAHSLHV
jgi:hypothetical protein